MTSVAMMDGFQTKRLEGDENASPVGSRADAVPEGRIGRGLVFAFYVSGHFKTGQLWPLQNQGLERVGLWGLGSVRSGVKLRAMFAPHRKRGRPQNAQKL
jgi:hypothetical protein